MFKQARPFFLIVETPLHAGSGNDLGIVDLPIQREKHTDYPKIEASSLKGSIREVFDAQAKNGEVKNDEVLLAFGPETGDLHAGALGFTDARLLLFPVKSVKSVFAWVTCPAVLERFKHDLSICQPTIDFVENIPDDNTVSNDSELFVREAGDTKKIVLEEYTFTVSPDNDCDTVANWISNNVLPSNVPSYGYWREKMKKDIVVLSDDDFRDFVMLSTEVIARTKIDSNIGTVATGALWYEEYLPTDSILYSLGLTTPLFVDEKKKKGTVFEITNQGNDKNVKEAKKVMDFLEDNLPSIIQIGGNATVGKGIVRTNFYQNEGESNGTGTNDTENN